MNKDKIIKDLKERNDKLANQYRLRDIRCIHLEYENGILKDKIEKALKLIYEELFDKDEKYHYRIDELGICQVTDKLLKILGEDVK